MTGEAVSVCVCVCACVSVCEEVGTFGAVCHVRHYGECPGVRAPEHVCWRKRGGSRGVV